MYNEPHTEHLTDTNYDIWMNGNANYTGMLEMYNAIRNTGSSNVIIIAGAQNYAYDIDSIFKLESNNKLENVMYNFHPYQGLKSYQQDLQKTPSVFTDIVNKYNQNINKPMIMTGTCGSYNGSISYDEAILQIAQNNNISWTIWAWMPGNNSCDYPSIISNGKLQNTTATGGGNIADLFSKYF